MGTSVGVSIVFTDLVGSTELSTSMGAGAADTMRRVHFRLLRAPVERFGGREVKNLGDGIMAVFPGIGAALDAAIAIQQAFHAHNASDAGHPMSIRVGVGTGDCTEEDGDYFGEPVIQAARLCSAAAGGQILAPEVVRFLAPRGRHEFASIGDLALKGIPDPVPAVEIGWRPIGSDGPALVPLPDRLGVDHATSFVGREAEREVLRRAWKDAMAGTRRMVLLAGEAGLGKTRLSSEFAREAFEDGALVLYGRCEEEMARPYGPWAEAISHYTTHSSEDEVARHDVRALSPLVPTLRRQGDLQLATAGDDEQYIMFAAVSDLLRTVAAARPVVIVLDDLHWADRGSLVLLRHVVGRAATGALMIIGTYRDTEIGADDPLTTTLAALRREAGVERAR